MEPMTTNQHPDDQAPAEWRRFGVDDEAEQALPEPSFQDPVAVGLLFCNALSDPAEYQVALRRVVTPESLPAWGDFSDAAQFLASIPDRGFGSMANRALGDDGVAYLKILSGVTQSFQVLEDQVVMAAGFVTLAWRPEFGEWRVHAFGGDTLRPEEVPHG
ncbi:hypothetical protein AB4Y77_00100 [Paenarthrobacter sp. YAF11_1]|uniref:hypothetical protein n=1 Tax=Paenarthrobacter sp. YAF11_1 TaxID=3233074 RepID=UPI003F9CCA59